MPRPQPVRRRSLVTRISRPTAGTSPPRRASQSSPTCSRTARDADPAAVATAYRETIADDLEALPRVEAMLADLRGEYRVGLLTNGPVRAQRDKLETLGWEDAFDAALVTGELEAGKPDPRAFEAITGELGVDPTDAVYLATRSRPIFGRDWRRGCERFRCCRGGRSRARFARDHTRRPAGDRSDDSGTRCDARVNGPL